MPPVSIPEGSADEVEQECTGVCLGWRDVAAAWLVHAGLRLATPDVRNRMLHVLADEWRAAVARALARSESMARHPAGKGGAPARPVHLADRMDAAHRARPRGAARRNRWAP